MKLKSAPTANEEGDSVCLHSIPGTSPSGKQKQRRCFKAILVILPLLIIIVLVGVILGVTVFRVKSPQTKLVSASVQGISPRVSFPNVKIELNITLNLTFLVHNPNHASFKGGEGQSVLWYESHQVGEAQLSPTFIPATGSSTLPCLLTLEVDRFADSGLSSLFNQIMAGQLSIQTQTKIPGRVRFLRIFRKHVVASSACQFVIAFPSMKLQSQDCKQHTKF